MLCRRVCFNFTVTWVGRICANAGFVEWIGVPEAEDEELVEGEEEAGEGPGGEREGMLEESRRRERQGVV